MRRTYDLLIQYAKEHCASTTATHKLLNAGRGNPNWVDDAAR
jgi:hypothetical protein